MGVVIGVQVYRGLQHNKVQIMSFFVFFLCLTVAYLAGLALAPFPYWPTYFLLWRTMLLAPGEWRTKRRQGIFLLKAGLAAPLWALLWYLDDILYPAYRKRVIKPVFIIGQPRCGTTLLHRTLAADDETFFAVRHIEWRYPFISVQKLIKVLGLDKRLGNVNYWPDSDVGKLAAKMHPNTLADWEEDGIFFEEKFLHHFFIFLRFPYPAQLEYFDCFPELPMRIQQRMLETHKKVLQKVLYLRGSEPRFYLSKEVTSHSKVPALIRLYTEARFVVIVRSAGSFMSSLMALMQMSTMSKTGIDPTTMPEWREALIRRMRVDTKRLVTLCQENIPAEKQLRVSADYFIKTIDVSVENLYRQLGFPLSKKFSDKLSSMQESQKVRQRGYDYSPLELNGFDEYEAFVRDVEAQYREKQPTSNQMTNQVAWGCEKFV